MRFGEAGTAEKNVKTQNAERAMVTRIESGVLPGVSPPGTRELRGDSRSGAETAPFRRARKKISGYMWFYVGFCGLLRIRQGQINHGDHKEEPEPRNLPQLFCCFLPPGWPGIEAYKRNKPRFTGVFAFFEA